ncbi:propionyl-CoA synthetase [Ferrovibrio sp.]|uniref:propionyl-CoA synthetase n=1 Tax=Ferrovibrio sp. TaxID=1917215 RepID=UPI0025BFBAF6|nr:propionyl-CoA synthetase [Ferrovibrio sp.]MBX3455595.1 propionyl-CoA synthetase [Ferrovibrio sp.]
MQGRYAAEYSAAQSDPNGYWGKQAGRVVWSKPYERVLDDSNPPFYRWYAGAETNTCYNALDRHVEAGHGERLALIYDSPVTNTIKRFSYAELRDSVAKLAGALRGLGVQKGDRVIIYMSMAPEAVMAMLACARIGAVHSVVFGGFAPRELATRIDDAKPVLIIASSCGLEPGRVVEYKPLLDQAIEIAAHKPKACLIHQRPMYIAPMIAGRDHDFAASLAAAQPAECVAVAATDPLYVLYTSGTTGIPKGVVRQNGGHMVALDWSMEHVYGVKPGEVFWAASDVGWVVGHSYIVYAPLIHGSTSLLYEGKPVGTPDAGAYWRVIEQHKVVALFTAPTAFRAIKKEDPKAELLKKYDLSQFRALFLAGERADPDTVHWAEDILGKPVIDHWWQTETGWPVSANFMGLELLPVKHGSATCAVPGYDVQVLDDDGHPVAKPGDIGNIAIKLPLPPGCLPTLWNNDEGFKKSYLARFPGYYNTGDAGFIDADGYIYIMSRTDDIINVAGHRLSTGGMEEVLASHPDVAECAVVGAADTLKGQVPLGFVVLKAGVTKPEEQILRELVALVREKIGPVAAFKQAVIVKRLPKTRSGKILRGTMQKIADAQEFRMPATIEDPVILTEIEAALKPVGYAKKA